MAIATRVGAPSTGALAGTGYGPGSLSAPYAVQLIATRACVPATTTYGMPIGAPLYRPAPKSGCSPVARPMLAISAAEFGSIGEAEISVFQAWLAGNASAPFNAAPAPSAALLKLP